MTKVAVKKVEHLNKFSAEKNEKKSKNKIETHRKYKVGQILLELDERFAGWFMYK